MILKNYSKLLEPERPLVIMSRGHSGTRVLGWALDKLGANTGAREVKGSADCQFFKLTNAIKSVADRHLHEPARAETNSRHVRLLQKRLVQYMEWLGETTPRWGWKFPETYMIGNYIEAIFPEALYIHMVRDGRDVAFKDHATDRQRKIGKTLLNHINAFEKPKHIRAALSWEFQVQRFEDFQQGLPENRVHTLSFEDLCQKPVETMEKLCQFIEMPMTKQCHEYLLNNVDASRVAQFKKHDPQQIKDIEALIGPTLQRWGYQ